MVDRDDATGGPLYSASIALLLLGLLFGFAVLPRLFRPTPSPLAGKEAPDFTLKVVANGADKTSLHLKDLRGHAVLLDFWATWCGPCQMEAPIVDRVAKRMKERGLEVVGVNTSDEDGNAAAWVRAHGISYTTVFDEGNEAARAYGVDSLPTIVVLGRDGKIAAVHTGMADEDDLEKMVGEAL